MDPYSTSYGTLPALDPAIITAIFVLALIVVIPICAGMWKVFTKAGHAGWKALAPFYNSYIMVKHIAQKPTWWFVMWFVPYVSIVFVLLTYLDVAKKFGKSAVFGVFGLLVFPVVGWPMLGFGPAQYQASAGAPTPATGAALPQDPKAPQPAQVSVSTPKNSTDGTK